MNSKCAWCVELIVPILFALGGTVSACRGQRRASPRLATTSDTGLYRKANTIAFLTAPSGAIIYSLGSNHGVLNLGSLSYFAGADTNREQIRRQNNSLLVSTTFCLRISASNNNFAGSTTISAFLLKPDPSRLVWVDGVRLTITPGIIGRKVPDGAITEHVLKLEVPISTPEGQLTESIGVIYTAN